MRFLLRAVAVLLALVVLLLAVGLALPSRFRVERSIEIAAPGDRVYRLIAAPAEWTQWTVWNQREAAMKIDTSGSAAGAGARWRWQSAAEGSGEMEFTEAVPDQRIGYRFGFPDVGMQSTGALTLAPAGGSVEVTWTNEGDLGSNPVNRWFGLFMDRLVGPDFEGGLGNLKQRAEAG